MYMLDYFTQLIKVYDLNTGQHKFNFLLRNFDKLKQMDFKPGMISLCFGSNQHLYISISALHCIQVYDKSGLFKFQFGSEGSNPGQFKGPGKIYLGPNHLLYIYDHFNNRIQIFDQHGNYHSKIELKNFLNSIFCSFTINSNGLIYLYQRVRPEIVVLQKKSSQSLYQILANSLIQTKNKHKKNKILLKK